MLGKIEALRKQRKALVGKEFRNNYCFVYFCLLLNLPIAAAEIEQRITEFNQGFLRPLSEYELRRTLATAWEKKYHLSAAKIVDFLDITKEEAKKLSIQFPNQVSAAEKRRLRNEEIVKLRNMGYTHSEIAKIVRASVKTVQTVAKGKGASTRAERILTLYESGLSRSEIAKAVNCTERYVRAVIKSGERSAQPEQTGNFSYNGLPQTEGPQGVPCPQGACQLMQALPPALVALRNELKKRYGIDMSDSDFDQHFALLLERIIPCGEPTLADVKADFSGQLSPSQDEMYRYFLNLT